MKLTPDSPELTALALDELDPAHRTEAEAALAADPALRAELNALRATAGRLERALAAAPVAALTVAQREALRAAARQSAPAEAPRWQPAREAAPSAPWWEGWLRPVIGFALAALVVAAGITLWPRPTDEQRFSSLRYQPGRTMDDFAPKPAPAVPAAEPLADAVKDTALTVADLPGARQAGAATATPSPAAPAAGGVALDKTKDTLAVSAQAGPPAAPLANGPAGTADSAGKVEASQRGRVLEREAVGRSLAAAPATSESLVRGESTTLTARYGLASNPAAWGLADSYDGLQRVPAGDATAGYDGQPSRNALGLQPLARVEQQVRLQSETLEERRMYFAEVPGLRTVEEAEVGSRARFLEAPTGENYAPIVENPFRDVSGAPLSTFGLDVDTASYANVRRMLTAGQRPPADAVRIEELVNYFRHGYAPPQGDDAFAIHAEITDCPWNEAHRLLRVGVKARELPRGERPPANLIFLVDVSGSMDAENKLPLVKQSLRLLLDQLTPRDTVGIVTYAGEAGVALAPTPAGEREQIAGILNRLRPGGSTAGAAGLEQAYALATNRFRPEGVNRVVLCTDGDFNVGVTSRDDLLELITRQSKSGVFLSVLGYGIGNYKDATAELLADKGNGNYAYIDSFREARKALVEQLEGTLVTVARDVKLQLEFNPSRVVSWRLLGYENRLLADRDFNDDTKDAGDIGAGHEITALYELVPVAGTVPGAEALRFASNTGRRPAGERPEEVVFIKLRHQPPAGGKSRLMEVAVPDTGRRWAEASPQTRFATAVAAYGLLLRDSQHKGALTWDQTLRLAEQTMGDDPDGLRAEFVDLVRRAAELAK